MDMLDLRGVSEKAQIAGQRCHVKYCRVAPERFCCRCERPTCARHGDYDEPLLFCQECSAALETERKERLGA